MGDLFPAFAFAVGTATTGLSCAFLLRRAGRPAAYAVVIACYVVFVIGFLGWALAGTSRLLAAVPIFVLGALPIGIDMVVRLTGGPRPVDGYLAVTAALSERLARYSPSDGSGILEPSEAEHWRARLVRWRSPLTNEVK